MSGAIVIGGGIAGISAAAHLAHHMPVTVLEGESHLAYHSTGRSAAIFILNYGNATLRALNAAALPMLSGQAGAPSVLSPRGELLLAGPEDMPRLEAYMEGTTGIDRLSPAEACKLVPALRAGAITAAIYEETAQAIDVDALLQGFARTLRDQGGDIRTNARVTAIARDGAGWRVEAGGDTLSADIVVNAAGAWADEVAKMAGAATVDLQPMRRSAVIMPVPEGLSYHHWPVIGSVIEDWYAKPEATGLMISPADEDPVPPQDAWPDDMVLAEGLDRFSRMVDLPLVRPSHSWAGLRSFVPDRTPVCGFAPDAPGFFWLAGQGGYGVQTAPALAALTGALVTGSEPVLPNSVVAALSPARFL